MATTDTLQPLLQNQTIPAPAAATAAILLPNPTRVIEQMASVNPAAGCPYAVGTATAAPSSPYQAPPATSAQAPQNWRLPAMDVHHGAGPPPPPPRESGMPSLTGAPASPVTAAPVNWMLAANKHGATPAQEITAAPPPPSGPEAPGGGTPSVAGVAAAPPPHSQSLPAMHDHHGAAPPSVPEAPGGGAPSLAPSAAGATPPPHSRSLPGMHDLPGAAPPRKSGTNARPAGRKWSLPSEILKAAEVPAQDGCIWRLDSASLPPGACTPMVVFLGPLFPIQLRRGMDETKHKYVHNLIRRAHRKEDTEQKLNEYLSTVHSMEAKIRQRYDQAECNVTVDELVEMMVLDGLFVIEVLINHWLGKINRGSASPQATADTVSSNPDYTAPLASTLVPQHLREDFTPLTVRWEPYALRFDLITVPNQIPFFVLEKLFKMTDVPELGEMEKQPSKLREIIISYLVGDGDGDGDAGDVLAGYKGPVYHILHLVYLHLTFSKDEETKESPLKQKASVVARSLSVDSAMSKLKQKGLDLRALYRRTFSRSSSLPVDWRQWKVIPPLRELVRVGVKLKRAETPRFAQVKFDKGNGVIEIPAFAWRRYHIRLLTNLVGLEMSAWWPPEKRLFCSYVRFMSELIMKKEDAALLFKKGVIQENIADDIEKSLICPFLILADFSHGSKYECHFDGLVRDLVHCYQRWSKIGAVTSSTHK